MLLGCRAFNATEKYESHQLVSLLESLGCPFGACQNAYTSVDETVYELDVPTDEGLKPLEEALDMIAQFAHAIRCATVLTTVLPSASAEVDSMQDVISHVMHDKVIVDHLKWGVLTRRGRW